MIQFVLVRRRQVRAQAPIAPVDKNPTTSRWLGLVDTVFDPYTGSSAGRAELLGIVVAADAANEEDAGRWKDVLGPASGILGCSASDEMVLTRQNIIVKGHVRVFGKDGVVGF